MFEELKAMSELDAAHQVSRIDDHMAELLKKENEYKARAAELSGKAELIRQHRAKWHAMRCAMAEFTKPIE